MLVVSLRVKKALLVRFFKKFDRSTRRYIESRENWTSAKNGRLDWVGGGDRRPRNVIAEGRLDTPCEITETLLIKELKPTLNDTVTSEKLYLY